MSELGMNGLPPGAEHHQAEMSPNGGPDVGQRDANLPGLVGQEKGKAFETMRIEEMEPSNMEKAKELENPYPTLSDILVKSEDEADKKLHQVISDEPDIPESSENFWNEKHGALKTKAIEHDLGGIVAVAVAGNVLVVMGSDKVALLDAKMNPIQIGDVYMVEQALEENEENIGAENDAEAD